MVTNTVTPAPILDSTTTTTTTTSTVTTTTTVTAYDYLVCPSSPYTANPIHYNVYCDTSCNSCYELADSSDQSSFSSCIDYCDVQAPVAFYVDYDSTSGLCTCSFYSDGFTSAPGHGCAALYGDEGIPGICEGLGIPKNPTL